MSNRKPSRAASIKPEPDRIALDVVPGGKGWSVKPDGSTPASGMFDTKAEAIAAARSLIHKAGGALRIHGRNGRIQESVTLGRKAASKIGAVEGIALDGEARRDLEAFDRQALSPEERRVRIARKYAAGAKAGR